MMYQLGSTACATLATLLFLLVVPSAAQSCPTCNVGCTTITLVYRQVYYVRNTAGSVVTAFHAHASTAIGFRLYLVDSANYERFIAGLHFTAIYGDSTYYSCLYKPKTSIAPQTNVTLFVECYIYPCTISLDLGLYVAVTPAPATPAPAQTPPATSTLMPAVTTSATYLSTSASNSQTETTSATYSSTATTSATYTPSSTYLSTSASNSPTATYSSTATTSATFSSTATYLSTSASNSPSSTYSSTATTSATYSSTTSTTSATSTSTLHATTPHAATTYAPGTVLPPVASTTRASIPAVMSTPMSTAMRTDVPVSTPTAVPASGSNEQNAATATAAPSDDSPNQAGIISLIVIGVVALVVCAIVAVYKLVQWLKKTSVSEVVKEMAVTGGAIAQQAGAHTHRMDPVHAGHGGEQPTRFVTIV